MLRTFSLTTLAVLFSAAFGWAGTIVLPNDADDVELNWPITGTLNSPFGPRQLGSQGARYDWHRGVDLSAPIGTDIFAPADAVVVHAGNHPGYADMVVQLRHNATEPYLYTLYLHLSDTEVNAGDEITAGTLIAKSGQGSATYPHLHWEVRRGCLNQQCCQSPYGYLLYPNTVPDPPELVASGYHPSLGRMILLEGSVPKTEIDVKGFSLDWGTDSVTADFDALNALTPSGQAGKLDDPLFFREEQNIEIVCLPKRFNSTYSDAVYQMLFLGLNNVATSGIAYLNDCGGLQSQANITVTPPPITMSAQFPSLVFEPASDFDLVYTITNPDAVSYDVDLRAISAQSLTLTLSTDTATIPAGGNLVVTVSGTLDEDFPEDVGDAILLIAEVDGGVYTDLLGATLIDTSASAGVGDFWTLE